MNRTTMAKLSRAPALLALVLQGCGSGGDGASGNGPIANGAPPASQLFADDFKSVCSGASVARAAAYNTQARGHKALYFETYKDGMADSSTSLPDDWTVQWSSEGDALAAIDTVVCARRTADREVKVCEGFTNNGAPTQNKVRWHTATYEMTLREARTGRQLAQSTVEATDTSCPMLQRFDSDTETVDGYATPSDTQVAEFARPHIVG